MKERLQLLNDLKVYKISSDFLYDLKVQSCKLYNNKQMIASTQIINTEPFCIHRFSSL